MRNRRGRSIAESHAHRKRVSSAGNGWIPRIRASKHKLADVRTLPGHRFLVHHDPKKGTDDVIITKFGHPTSEHPRAPPPNHWRNTLGRSGRDPRAKRAKTCREAEKEKIEKKTMSLDPSCESKKRAASRLRRVGSGGLGLWARIGGQRGAG